MQRASFETIVLNAERSFEPAISRPQLSALLAELWHPTSYGAHQVGTTLARVGHSKFWIFIIDK